MVLNISNACASYGLIIVILAVLIRLLPLRLRSIIKNHAFIVVERVKAILGRLVSVDPLSKLLVFDYHHGFTSDKAIATWRITELMTSRRRGIDKRSTDKLLARNQRGLDAPTFFFGLFLNSLYSPDKHSLSLSF